MLNKEAPLPLMFIREAPLPFAMFEEEAVVCEGCWAMVMLLCKRFPLPKGPGYLRL